MDSGAFSAWTRKITIKLGDYIRFCKQNDKFINYVVNLDVIPAEYGNTRPTKEMVQESARKGWENYQRMLESGIDPRKIIPVFHQGEEMHWLDKMLYYAPSKYIGISPANDRTPEEKKQWLKQCHAQIMHRTNGDPREYRFHGFAVTSIDLLTSFPWGSVDSTTWLITSNQGSIFIPLYGNDYLSPIKVNVTAGTTNDPFHIERMRLTVPSLYAFILEYIHSEGYILGSSDIQVEYESLLSETPSGLAVLEQKKVRGKRGKGMTEQVTEIGLVNDYRLRNEFNLNYFREIERQVGFHIYIAGYGHPFERTPFFETREHWNILLSYYSLAVKPDNGMIKRFHFIKEKKYGFR
jgi:hypothetical protein